MCCFLNAWPKSELQGSGMIRFCSFCFCLMSHNFGLHADSHHQKEVMGLPLRRGCLEKSCLFKLTAHYYIKPTTVSKEHNWRNTVLTGKSTPLMWYSASGCLPLCNRHGYSGCKRTTHNERSPSESSYTWVVKWETHTPEAATTNLCTLSPQRPCSKQVFVTVTEAGTSKGKGLEWEDYFLTILSPPPISGPQFLLSNEVAVLEWAPMFPSVQKL